MMKKKWRVLSGAMVLCLLLAMLSACHTGEMPQTSFPKTEPLSSDEVLTDSTEESLTQEDAKTEEPITGEQETKEPETKEPETKEPETKEPETEEPKILPPEGFIEYMDWWGPIKPFQRYYPFKMYRIDFLSSHGIFSIEEVHQAAIQVEQSVTTDEIVQIPSIYLMIQAMGIPKETFIQVNEAYKAKPTSDYPAYTDEEIEGLYLPRDQIKEALKLDYAFFYEGNLYNLEELSYLEDAKLKEMIAKGGLNEFFEKNKVYSDWRPQYWSFMLDRMATIRQGGTSIPAVKPEPPLLDDESKKPEGFVDDKFWIGDIPFYLHFIPQVYNYKMLYQYGFYTEGVVDLMRKRIERKEWVPVFYLLIKEMEIPKETFIQINEAHKNALKTKPQNSDEYPAFTDEQIDLLYSCTEEEIRLALKTEYTFLYEGQLHTVGQLVKLNSERPDIFREMVEKGGLSEFLEQNQKYADWMPSVWVPLQKLVDEVKGGTSIPAAGPEPPEPPLLNDESKKPEGFVDDKFWKKSAFELYFVPQAYHDKMLIQYGSYSETFVDLMRKNWAEESRQKYGYTDQIPLIYYLIREMKISKESFIQINEAYKEALKTKPQNSDEYPAFTDEQIDLLYSCTEEEIRLALKTDYAFMYKGVLYNVALLKKAGGTDPVFFREMVEKGGLSEFLEQNQKYADWMPSVWVPLQKLVDEVKKTLPSAS
ncbi:MAG: hypothetical protein IKD31_05025 [Clostridia bacterium]|nr:hypothetical protein [Clostridia bacterium]